MNIGESKKRLDELLRAAINGEEVTICRYGKPRLEPVLVTASANGEGNARKS